ncbi:MAG: hypothetical protein PHP10_02845 [Candidatus Omnitrophica bacterium]|nr:hypothetical protein [Candidatus Omnitrophota bacterium]
MRQNISPGKHHLCPRRIYFLIILELIKVLPKNIKGLLKARRFGRLLKLMDVSLSFFQKLIQALNLPLASPSAEPA